MDKFREGEDNPFDAPIPGQGLTDEPGNYPWEHPPQFTDPDEAAEFVWDRLHRPEFMEQVIAIMYEMCKLGEKKPTPMKEYLCIEHGEYFTVFAKSLEHAKELALTWGGEAIKELPHNPE